jgi:hypothetical protein
MIADHKTPGVPIKRPDMSAKDLTRIRTAQELRKKADRYRHLARSIDDRRAMQIIETVSRELDERAREIESEVANGDGSKEHRSDRDQAVMSSLSSL